MANPNAKAVRSSSTRYKKVLLWMKAHVEGMRALNTMRYCMDLVKARQKKSATSGGPLELLIPVCKAYTSEKSFQVCSKAIDVYGVMDTARSTRWSRPCATAR